MPESDDWHEEILEFLSFMFELQYRRNMLSYSVRKRNALMIDNVRGRRPDVAVIERPPTQQEDRKPGIRTIPKLIVEIASGSWSTDLIDRQGEYEALKMEVYWIVDYRGQIPAKYCLQDQGAKVVVLKLTNGIYQKTEYLQGEVVSCSMFLELKLTVDQILAAKE